MTVELSGASPLIPEWTPPSRWVLWNPRTGNCVAPFSLTGRAPLEDFSSKIWVSESKKYFFHTVLAEMPHWQHPPGTFGANGWQLALERLHPELYSHWDSNFAFILFIPVSDNPLGFHWQFIYLCVHHLSNSEWKEPLTRELKLSKNSLIRLGHLLL